MTSPEFTVELLAPESLVPHDLNPRRHPDQQKEALRQSLAEHGYLSAPIVNVRTGKRILDGHARVELALANGEATIPCRVIDVPEAQEKRILRMFDAIGSLAEIDTAALDRLIEAIDDASLERLLGELSEPESGLLPEADPDAVPEQVETRCQPGDLWLLGEHRLLCGDSTKREDVERLMGGKRALLCLTDPPYNVGVDYRSWDDLQSESEYRQFSRQWWQMAAAVSDCIIMTPGMVNLALWYSGITDTPPRWCAAWFKPNQCSRSALGGFNCWEPLLIWGRMSKNLARDAWEYAVRQQSDTGDHPCPKQVGFWSQIIEAATESAALVFDPFAGSGTTIIACQQAGRLASCIEVDPHYCDVVIARFEAATGQKAKLLARSA